MSYTSHLACLGIGAMTTWVYTIQKHKHLEERIRLLEGAIVRLDKRDDHLWNLYNIRYRSDFTFKTLYPTFTDEISNTDSTGSTVGIGSTVSTDPTVKHKQQSQKS